MYKNCFKRIFDFCLSLMGIIILSPLFLILIIIGMIEMGGNPFFTQERPGKDEKIFKLIKFRTMTNKKDQKGKLLPDEQRLTKFGNFLRKTSLDELPELWLIFCGSMSMVGPRPLLVEYLPYYTEEEHHRHDVRPGLTGLAQVSGRNLLSWEERLDKDIEYVKDITFRKDAKIFLKTFVQVIKREGVNDAKGELMAKLDVMRKGEKNDL